MAEAPGWCVWRPGASSRSEQGKWGILLLAPWSDKSPIYGFPPPPPVPAGFRSNPEYDRLNQKAPGVPGCLPYVGLLYV